MTTTPLKEISTRPEHIVLVPLTPMPDVSGQRSDEASTAYSHYRTKLSRHRTELSEHRTGLSEFRTDLSQHRTDLSKNRTDLATRRTGMAFHRTRMAADRTLMAFIRTSLSLIAFGFTLYQAFEKLRDAGVVQQAAAPRNFGLALVLIGVLLLVGGITNHARFELGLRHLRSRMTEAGLIPGDYAFPVSITFISAVILLAVGLFAAASILFNFSLFG